MSSFIKKTFGMVVINNVDDTEGQQLETPSPKSKRKKKGKDKQAPSRGGRSQPPQDAMADLTEEARTTDNTSDEIKTDPTICDHLLYHDKLRILYVVLLCLMLGLAIPYILSVHFHTETIDDGRYCGLNITYRMECLAGTLVTESSCKNAGCCFDVQMGDPYAPTCFHSIPSLYRYTIESSKIGDTVSPVKHNRVPISYSLEEEPFSLELSPVYPVTPTGDTSWALRAHFQRQGENIVRIKIWSPEHPQDIDDSFVEIPPTDWKLDVQVAEVDGQFNVSVSRNETGEEIFNTAFGPLIFGEDYTEITARIPSYDIYGVGRRGNYDLMPSLEMRERWTLFNYDSSEDDTFSHSSHPFYMNFEQSGMMHGVYLHNAAPVEIGVTPVPGVVFKTLGGSLDLTIFAGPTPHDVTNQYVNIVGQPAMPPYWALGYHLCRTSDDSKEFESTFEEMVNRSLPYESDCLDARLTYPGSFQDISDKDKARVEFLKSTGRKFWLVQYPFLTPDSESYIEAQNRNLLLMVNSSSANDSSVNYYGKVDEKSVAYPDFLQNNTITWLNNIPGIKNLYNQADGIILFQNSPLNEVNPMYGLPVDVFCNETTPRFCCPQHSVPYYPEGISDLNNHTLCMAIQHSELPGEAGLHLRSHNMYGRSHHQQLYDFKKSLQSNKGRPLLTSQSTFPGSGAIGGQFGGNYQPNFVAQKKGLVHILQMGLYGVPFSGVPICGSTNDTNANLKSEWCIRGHQLSTFLPFMMSHYEKGHSPRNPPNFPAGFMEKVKYFIRLRYMLLPYMYDLFRDAHMMGTPVARPLFYEFPDDQESREIDTQFLLGNALMVSPVFALRSGDSSVDKPAHFPPGCWYDFYKGTLVSHSANGENLILPTLLSDINVHILGGTILPLQGDLHTDFSTTADFRLRKLSLIVALPCELQNITTSTTTTASPLDTTPVPPVPTPPPVSTTKPEVTKASNGAYGSLYMDDGETAMDENPPHYSITFEATNTTLTITRQKETDPSLCGYTGDNPIGFTKVIDIVQIFGVFSPIKTFKVEGSRKSFTQDPETYVITAKNLNIDWCLRETTVVTWE